ncbi:MAG TPA: cobaltochelatase subunit CobN, partial [Beijerinckia sp.]|nr:cobaltochelatase subunit CobN [Beijerinckia sp.]
MHLLRTETRSLDEAEAAIDLAQTPADLVFLSFSDSDLGLFAKVSEGRATNLRLANIAQLKHPFSVDLYIEKMASKARFVLVRLLGGLDYWRYGIEELSLTARAQNFDLAVIPGDDREDLRLDAASTLPVADLRRLWAYLHNGGIANLCELLNWIENRIGEPRPWRDPCPVAIADRFEAGCREPAFALGRVLIVFYRSFMLSGDCEPIIALADALASRKLCVTAVHVTSLKDADVISFMRDVIAQEPPDIIINTTAFSARLDSGPSILDCADAPVLQAILAGSFQAQWEANPRGLNAADLAMNVVLPEMDGRIITPAIAFKAEAERHEDLEFTPLVHLPLPSRIDHVSELAWRWIYLRKTPPAQRKIACILSDYPGKGGRAGYAVGLDTGKSISSIAAVLREAGYDIGALPDPGSLMRKLEAGEPNALFTLEDYRDALRAMPEAFVQSVHARWGEPEQDENVTDGAFHFSFVRAGHLLIGLQPDRGSRTNRKAEYHGGLAPRHSYIAFYLWLRVHEKVHALIHCGTHGTLEWLPGKAVALSECCTPEAVLGAIPVIYPFIVNNPGEAAQA